jgi:hypothetical protein
MAERNGSTKITSTSREHRAGYGRPNPFRSEAIVLGIPDHPAKADVAGHLVIRCFDGPSLDRLEPFLAPLR